MTKSSPATLAPSDLARATGGNNERGRVVTDPTRCTPDNPRGERIWHQSVTNPR